MFILYLLFAHGDINLQLYVNEVVLGTAFGIFMGPHFAGIFDPRSWGAHSNAITLEVMRIVLATGLFAIGVELPKSYMAKHAKSLLAMVIPTMAIGWVIVAGVYPRSFVIFIFSMMIERGMDRAFACAVP
jgi:NhaP-type Na+/H+ or K+/H+ antiporter